MRTFRTSLTLGLSGVICIGLVACSGMSDKDPLEFTQAKTAIDDAEANDVDKHFPNTLTRASATLDRAEDLYKEANKNEDLNIQAQQRTEAVQEAVKARELAQNAKLAYRTVQGWDQNIEEFDARNPSGVTPREAIATNNVIEPSRTPKTVAFFDVGSAEILPTDDKALDATAKALLDNPNLNAQIIGYTDPRGSAARNKALADARVKAVVEQLQAYGVSPDRLTLRPVGEHQTAVDAATGKKHWQMDRKVDVFLFDTAKASEDLSDQPRDRTM